MNSQGILDRKRDALTEIEIIARSRLRALQEQAVEDLKSRDGLVVTIKSINDNGMTSYELTENGRTETIDFKRVNEFDKDSIILNKTAAFATLWAKMERDINSVKNKAYKKTEHRDILDKWATSAEYLNNRETRMIITKSQSSDKTSTGTESAKALDQIDDIISEFRYGMRNKAFMIEELYIETVKTYCLDYCRHLLSKRNVSAVALNTVNIDQVRAHVLKIKTEIALVKNDEKQYLVDKLSDILQFWDILEEKNVAVPVRIQQAQTHINTPAVCEKLTRHKNFFASLASYLRQSPTRSEVFLRNIRRENTNYNKRIQDKEIYIATAKSVAHAASKTLNQTSSSIASAFGFGRK